MQQPELGRGLVALRKQKNLTQEELAENSHVSVRTIQRIEAGEVLPRMSTVKLLLETLGETMDTFSARTPIIHTKRSDLQSQNKNTLLTAALAGSTYLAAQIILGALDIDFITGDDHWSFGIKAIYITLTIIMVISYILFLRGFISLSLVFENTLLKVVSYVLIIATIAKSGLDISSLSVQSIESLWLPYSVTSITFGSLSIVFGVSLIRLQDGMGELSRIAGILEIVMGCILITVILFFISYVVMIPAVVLEILVLYRGYEYLSRPESIQDINASQ